MDGAKYLIKISLPVLFVVFGAVFAVRSCSLTQSYSPHPHPIYSLERPWALVELTVDEEPPRGSPADLPLWRLTPDTTVSWKSLEPDSAEAPVALFLPENHPGFSDELIASVKEHGWEDRMIFLSPHDGLLKDLRKDLPGALFSMGQGDTTQLFMLHALFLEPAAQLNADYLVAEPQFLGQGGQLPPRLVDELHRRKKALIIDLRETEDFPFTGLPADGYLLKEPHKNLEKVRALRTKDSGQEAL